MLDNGPLEPEDKYRWVPIATWITVRAAYAIIGVIVTLGLIGYAAWRNMGAFDNLSCKLAIGAGVFALLGPSIQRAVLNLDHNDRPY